MDILGVVKDLANRLSHVLGVEASIVKEHSTDGDKYVIRLIDTGGKVFPQLRIGSVSYELEVREPTLPSPIDVVLKVGDEIRVKSWYHYIGCRDNANIVACTSEAIANRIRESIAGVRLLDELVSSMRESKIQVSEVSCLQLCKDFYVSAVYDNVSIKVRYSDLEGEYLTVKARFPSQVIEYFLRSRSNMLTALRKAFERNNLEGISIEYLDPDDEKPELHISTRHRHASTVTPSIIAIHDMLNKEDKRIRELLARVDPVDALVLYMFDRRGVNGLHEALTLILGSEPYGFLKDRAKDYLKNAVGNATVVDELLENPSLLAEALFERGRLTIDSEGYLALEGRRLVDIVEKHVRSVPRADEILRYVDIHDEKILADLLEKFNIDVESLAGGRGIPDRLVDIITHHATLMSKYFSTFIKHSAWSKLSREARIKVLASKPEAVDLARENSYTWVFEDPYLVAEALTRSKNPDEATRALLEHFPEFLGSKFNVVYAGGEPFIKLGNVVLQIRQVDNNTVSAHGTVGTSRIGMVANGRSVASIAATIAECLTDAVIELKEIARELQSYRHVKIEEHKTPLFTIPVIAVHTGQGTVKKIPLQPGLKTILTKKYTIGTSEYEKITT